MSTSNKNKCPHCDSKCKKMFCLCKCHWPKKDKGEDMTLAERIELIVYRYKSGMYDEKGATDKILEVFKESLPKSCQCCNWEKVREEILKKLEE